MNSPCAFDCCLGLESIHAPDMQHCINDLGLRQDHLERRLGALVQLVWERLATDGDAGREVQ